MNVENGFNTWVGQPPPKETSQTSITSSVAAATVATNLGDGKNIRDQAEDVANNLEETLDILKQTPTNSSVKEALEKHMHQASIVLDKVSKNSETETSQPVRRLRSLLERANGFLAPQSELNPHLGGPAAPIAARIIERRPTYQ